MDHLTYTKLLTHPAEVEAAIIDYYRDSQLDGSHLDHLKTLLLEDLEVYELRRDAEVKRLKKVTSGLQQERRVIADRTMDGSLPSDIAKEKQAALAKKLAHAETELERHLATSGKVRFDIDKVFELAHKSSDTYCRSKPELRRELNLAFFEALEIDLEDYVNVVVRGRETPLFQGLRNAQIPRMKTPGQNRPRSPVNSFVNGSTVELLVGRAGLEPATPCVSWSHDPAYRIDLRSNLRLGQARRSMDMTKRVDVAAESAAVDLRNLQTLIADSNYNLNLTPKFTKITAKGADFGVIKVAVLDLTYP